MEQALEQLRDQQKASWNTFAAGWKKWDDLTMAFMQPVGAEIIRMIHPQKTDVILDIASGTGEPGLTIASMLDGGIVVMTDLSDNMLAIARENAARKGVTNVEMRTCDVSELPFDDNTFDAISCRFGFMFFPDMLLAAKEMLRVLKPGGKMALSVWDMPAKNYWVTAIMGPINKHMQLPPPPPGSPGMFRCAPDGMMEDLFLQAGFKNVCQNEIGSVLRFDTAEKYWEMMNDVGAPIVAALANADDAKQQTIKEEVLQQLHEKFPAGSVAIDAGSLVIYGEK